MSTREILSLALLYKMPVLVKSNWNKKFNENGETYYENIVTGEKQYEIPIEYTEKDYIFKGLEKDILTEEGKKKLQSVMEKDITQENWKEFTDDNGSIYYYNTETGETQLDNPYINEGLIHNTKWAQYYDKDENSYNYHNKQTGETQWNIPDEIIELQKQTLLAKYTPSSPIFVKSGTLEPTQLAVPNQEPEAASSPVSAPEPAPAPASSPEPAPASSPVSAPEPEPEPEPAPASAPEPEPEPEPAPASAPEPAPASSTSPVSSDESGRDVPYESTRRLEQAVDRIRRKLGSTPERQKLAEAYQENPVFLKTPDSSAHSLDSPISSASLLPAPVPKPVPAPSPGQLTQEQVEFLNRIRRDIQNRQGLAEAYQKNPVVLKTPDSSAHSQPDVIEKLVEEKLVEKKTNI